MLKGRRILITGASRGIGRALALELAARGAHLGLISRDLKSLELVQKECLAVNRSITVSVLACDVSKTATIFSSVEKIAKDLSGLDGLVNNAAALLHKPAMEQSAQEIEALMKTNVVAPFEFCRSFASLAPSKAGPRSVVNISSLAGIQKHTKIPGLSAYSASKAAVIAMTEALAEEWKSIGIRVNSVCPGATDTQMLREAFPQMHARAQPLDVAKTICFLLDDEESGIMTGSSLDIFSN